MKINDIVRRFTRISRINFLRWFVRFDIPGDFYMLILATIVGLLTGFGAYLLNIIVDSVHVVLYEWFREDLVGLPSGDYLRIIFPGIGGLIVGIITYYFSSEVKGHGVPGVMEAVANKGGLIRRRVVALTSINSGLTIGSGGSAGKEGPIVSIGAAIGSGIGQFFHVSPDRLKILVGCGAAAGLAAVFNAPVAGVVFAVEVILVDFSVKAFSPIIIASVISTALSHALIGSSPMFEIPDYALNSVNEFPLYLVLGLAGGVLSAWFTKSLYWVEDRFEELQKLQEFLKPLIGGLMVGLMAYWLPELYGFDDSATYTALLGRKEIWLLAVMVIAKILATSFTLGSGATGGLFTPSLFIGAMFGALYGKIVALVFPGIVAPAGAYALVGMGVVVAGTIHAPLSAFLIIFETTSDYKIILPLMLGTVASTIVARMVEKDSIYTKKISLFSGHISSGRNMDFLRTRNIHPIIRTDIKTVQENTSFSHILDLLISGSFTSFPVVTADGKLAGMITMRDIQPILFDRDLYPLLIARDVMSENVFVLNRNDSLEKAFQKVELGDFEMLPVVSDQESMHYEGVVAQEDLMRQYRKEMLLMTDQKD